MKPIKYVHTLGSSTFGEKYIKWHKNAAIQAGNGLYSLIYCLNKKTFGLYKIKKII